MKLLKLIALIMLTMFLSGCFHKVIEERFDNDVQLFQSRLASLKGRLGGYDVAIIQNECSITLVIPNERLFNANSANFTQKAYKVLDLVFDLTSYYVDATGSISGFAKSGITDNISMAIADERAHKVISYLWELGTSAAFVYVDGRNLIIHRDRKKPFTDCVVINFRKPV